MMNRKHGIPIQYAAWLPTQSLRNPYSNGITEPPAMQATRMDEPVFAKRPRPFNARGNMAGYITEHPNVTIMTAYTDSRGGRSTTPSGPAIAIHECRRKAPLWLRYLGIMTMPKTYPATIPMLGIRAYCSGFGKARLTA